MSDNDPLITTLEEWIDVFMHHSMRNFIHYARKSGLTMSQLGTLFHLNSEGTTGVTDLGEHLGVTSAGASQLLDRLVQQGLIQRTEDPQDRRVKQIVLTDEGCRIFEESVHARQGWLDDLVNVIPDNEKASITTALNTLIERANQIGINADIASQYSKGASQTCCD
jgi:DNA-binding MarR family transcriptional regulator